MKIIRNILKWLLIIAFVLAVGAKFTGNGYLLKGLWASYLHGEKTATITDIRFFDSREIKAGNHIPLAVAESYNQRKLSNALTQSLEDTRSVAFLILHRDSIVYEQYWDGFSDSSLSNSFSMAKSITTMLAQCAIQDGFIKSWDQKVTDFFPDIKGAYAAGLTLRHLSTMTAGLDYNEHYTNPFDITARTYYGNDVQALMLSKVPAANPPGNYEYQSGATQWLGMVVIKATGKPLADYASEKLWKPLGAKHTARWHLDNENGNELAFCCFNTNARDFARFGIMMTNNGKFNGRQILDSSFLAVASKPFVEPYYGHSFWIDDSYGTPVFYQRGILGQYIINIPEKDLVIVRLGHALKEKDGQHPKDFKIIVKEVLEMY